MTPKQAAKEIDGKGYGNETTRDLDSKMKAAGVVAVFGASDDLLEFRGAIYDELGAYGGKTVPISSKGLFKRQCDNEDCPHEEALLEAVRKAGKKIDAVWCPKELECSWLITTNVPHETFDVMKDGQLFCRGVVFRLSDC
jgi:hypothetical protein